MARVILSGAVAALCAVATAATVSVRLASPVAGGTIAPGTQVHWTVTFTVSTGDNLGLALIVADLVQDAANPEKFNIPPGDTASIDATMDDFSRPLGVSNAGEAGATTGYIGVQRGAAGAMNLVQIGGGQNTFGGAGPPGLGQDCTVNPGVGQGPTAQVLLSGSFPAPATQGMYTFRLANAVANVLEGVGTPPAHSPAASATVDLTNASFSFTVQGICVGDLNCDGQIDFHDINPFVQFLSNFAAWQNTYPGCNPLNGDINGDGIYGFGSFGDINPFVTLLGSAPLPIPCP